VRGGGPAGRLEDCLKIDFGQLALRIKRDSFGVTVSNHDANACRPLGAVASHRRFPLWLAVGASVGHRTARKWTVEFSIFLSASLARSSGLLDDREHAGQEAEGHGRLHVTAHPAGHGASPDQKLLSPQFQRVASECEESELSTVYETAN
jgi:hypothetical protein